MAICSVCNSEITSGYMSECANWYCCDQCMKNEITVGNLRISYLAELGMENEFGGYYEELVGCTWMDTDIFWTEWNDDDSEALM